MNSNHFDSPTVSSPDVTSLIESVTSEDRLDSDIEADLQQTQIASEVERFSVGSSDALFGGSCIGAAGGVSDTGSHKSGSLTEAGGELNQSTFFQSAILSGIASQMRSLSSKMDIGSPSCLSYRTHLVIGTTKGLIFVFSLRQVLRFCFGSSTDTKDNKADSQGSITSLCQNRDGTLLLSGYTSGRIAVWQLTAPPSTTSKDGRSAMNSDEQTAENTNQGVIDLSLDAEAPYATVKSLSNRLSSFRTGGGSAAERLTSRLLCVVDDAHGANQAIHFCLFTTIPSLAVCVDTGGSVFQLHFRRGLTGLKRESVCFFSGSRGEICGLDALGSSANYTEHLAGCVAGDSSSHTSNDAKVDFSRSANSRSLVSYALIAMASFTKLIVATLRPRIQIVYWQPLKGPASCLPLLSWQWDHRPCACSCSSRAVLAFGRGSVVHLLRVSRSAEVTSNRSSSVGDTLQFELTNSIELSYDLLTLNWISSKNQMVALDNSSHLHLLDSSNGGDIETLDLSSIELSYNLELFQGLQKQGLISEALASAGVNACAHSVSVYGSKIVMLGRDGITVFAMRTWVAIVKSLFAHGSLKAALAHCNNALLASQAREFTDSPTGKLLELSLPKVPSIPEYPLSFSSLRNQVASLIRQYVLPLFSDWPESQDSISFTIIRAVVSVASRVDSGELLFNDLYPLLEPVEEWQSWFFIALVQLLRNLPVFGVLSGEKLVSLSGIKLESQSIFYAVPPPISTNLVEWCLAPSKQRFRAILVEQESALVSHEDPGRVWAEQCLLRLPPSSIDLNQAVKLCWNHHLYTAYLHLYTNILLDFETPFKELLGRLQEQRCDLEETFFSSPSQSDCGQHLLLLIRAAFAGESSSQDSLPSSLCVDVPSRIFNLLLNESMMSSKSQRSTYSHYPRLRILLEHNAVDFLNMLTLSISSDSFFQEGELGVAHRTHLLHKLIACTLGATPNAASSSSLYAPHVFQFIVRQLTSPDNSQVELEEPKLLQLFELVCNDNVGHTERTSLPFQSAVIELLSVNRFTDIDTCLTLAQKAGLNYVCEYIHRVRGERLSAFRDQLNELEQFVSKHSSVTTELISVASSPELLQLAEQIFVFLEQVFPLSGNTVKTLSDVGLTSDEVSSLRGTVVKKLEVLTIWDAERTLRILYGIFGNSVSELLVLLFPEFSLHQSGGLANLNECEDKLHSTCLNLLRVYFRSRQALLSRLHPMDRSPDELPDHDLVLLTRNGWNRFLTELEPSVSEYYIYLLSQQSSSQEATLLPFLVENLSTYRPAVVLQMLSVERHPNEMAYLYETLGELEKAAELYEKTFINSWNSSTQALPSDAHASSVNGIPPASSFSLNMSSQVMKDDSRTSADCWFAFCQRQTSQDGLPKSKVEQVWFHVIDVLLSVQATLTESRLIREMNEVFHLLMSYIPSSISLPTVVSYVLQSANKENAAKFDNKTNALVTRLVATCQFEADQMILNTQLARTDLTLQLASGLARFARGFGTCRMQCGLCALHLRSSLALSRLSRKDCSSGTVVVLFRCRHVFHSACLQDHSSGIKSETVNPRWFCPLCEPNNILLIPSHSMAKNVPTQSLPTLSQDDPIRIDIVKPPKLSNPFDD